MGYEGGMYDEGSQVTDRATKGKDSSDIKLRYTQGMK